MLGEIIAAVVILAIFCAVAFLSGALAVKAAYRPGSVERWWNDKPDKKWKPGRGPA